MTRSWRRSFAFGLIAALILSFGWTAAESSAPRAYADGPSAPTQTVYPKEIDDVLHNPDMGWVLIDNAVPGHIDAGRTGTYPEVDNVAVLSTWADLEPTEGQYDWSLVDQAIQYWSGLGKRIHFRISTDPMVISTYGYSKGAPEWLYSQYNVPYQIRTDTGGPVKFPDYTNAIYQQKLSAFLTAFGNKYKNDPALDIVDLRGYGYWGEWHSGHDFPDYATRENTLQTMVDKWYDAFGGQKILALSNSYEYKGDLVPTVNNPASYADYQSWSAFDYALTKSNLTFRRDGVSGALLQYDSLFLNDFFASNRKLPIVLEFFSGYAQYKNGQVGAYTPDRAMDEALSYHPNYMSMMGWSADESAKQFYDERPDLIARGNKEFGYRFVLSEATYPQWVEPGGTLKLDQKWVNCAAGRSYKPYALKAYLTDAGGNEVWSGTDAQFDATAFVKGRTYDASSSFALPAGLAAGTYDLRIALVDATGQPKIKLAIDGKDAQTRYKLGTIRIGGGSETFEGGSFASSSYTPGFNGAYGQIASGSSTVVSGVYSAYGSAPQSTVWYEFLYSDTNKLRLSGKGTYTVTFKTKTSAAPGAGGSQYFLVRSDAGGYAHDKGVTEWNDAPGSGVHARSVTFTLDDYADYKLVWGLHNGGAMVVDEIAVVRKDDLSVGLLGEWKLDEGTGSTATDASGNGNAGTLVGDPVWKAGVSGSGLSFGGSESYVSIPNSATTENAQEGDYSLAAWFKPNASPPGTGSANDANYAILMKNGWSLGLYYDGQRKFKMAHVLAGDTAIEAVSAKAYTPGSWHCVVGVVNRAAGTVRLYVDGELQASATFAPGAAAREYNQDTWKLGMAVPGAAAWAWPAKGEIDEARLYGRALSAEEAKRLYEREDPSPKLSHIGDWQLNEGSGVTAADASGNGNAGTLAGGAAWTAGRNGGKAVTFGSSGGYVQLANSGTLENAQEGSYTVTAWFKPNSVPAGTGSANNANYAIAMKSGWSIGLYYDNQKKFHMAHVLAGDTGVEAVSGGAFNPGSWYYVVGVVNRAAGTVKIFVNGTLQGTAWFAPETAAREYGTETWKLGIGIPGASQWGWQADGAIDSAAIYGSALEDADVQALYYAQ